MFSISTIIGEDNLSVPLKKKLMEVVEVSKLVHKVILIFSHLTEGTGHINPLDHSCFHKK